MSKSENQRKISLQIVTGGSLTLVLIKNFKCIGTWQKSLLALEIKARRICLDFSLQIGELHCWV